MSVIWISQFLSSAKLIISVDNAACVLVIFGCIVCFQTVSLAQLNGIANLLSDVFI